MIRLLLAFSGVLLCGSIAAFFLFVPPLWIAAAVIATVFLLVTGLVLLIRFGIQAELQQAAPPDSDD